jgi:hypothetical protein
LADATAEQRPQHLSLSAFPGFLAFLSFAYLLGEAFQAGSRATLIDAIVIA